MTKAKKNGKRYLIKAAELKAQMQAFSHPLNPESQMQAVQLGVHVGLSRIGISLARIPPGKESFIYHSHESEEEFIYILSGRGIAEIDEGTHEVGPGDFMGFPTPSVGHHLRNPFEEDLVYLMGGESLPCEVAAFPKIGKRLIRMGTKAELYDLKDAHPLGTS